MKKISIIFSIFALAFSAVAQQKITASIQVTNLTLNGYSFSVNGSTRFWTNNPANSATMVLTNSDVTGCGSKTNLLTQIYANPFSQVTETDTGSNSFNLIGNANLAMAVSVSGAYASVAYSTQTVSSIIGLQGPIASLPTAQARTNAASDIAGALNAPENTNQIQQTSLAATQLTGTTNTQTISGSKTFSNPSNSFFGTFDGTVTIANTQTVTGAKDFNNTNSVWRAPVSNSPSIGGAISQLNGGTISNAYLGWSGGSFINAGGQATFHGGVAISTVFNIGAIALNDDLGDGSFSLNYIFNGRSPVTLMNFWTNYVAMFQPTIIQATLEVNSNITADSSVSVATNLTVGKDTVFSGNFSPQGLTTNQTWKGTNNFSANSDIAFTRYAISTIANGNNSAIQIGTNVFFELSGMSGAFATCGFANGRDGKFAIGLNQSGDQWTIPNESGSDPTPANRIRTLTGADVIVTNAACIFLYSGAANRWLLISHNP